MSRRIWLKVLGIFGMPEATILAWMNRYVSIPRYTGYALSLAFLAGLIVGGLFSVV